MPAYAHATIIGYLARWDDPNATAPEKGKAFEELACYLFSHIPGITITSRNELNTFATEEIDIACHNIQEPDGLRSLNPFLLVECKGWASAVTSVEVSWFLSKIEHRGLDFGVLIAANGITGVAEHLSRANFMVALALAQKRIRMVIITREEIETLKSGEELAQMIIEKVTRLHATGGRCY